jgi:hypothetical protein
VSDHAAIERLELPGPLRAPTLTVACAALVAVGVIGFLVAYFCYGELRAWSALLQGLMVPLTISAGATAFLAMNSIGGARWTIPIQRLIEGLGEGFPIVMLGVLVLVLCGSSIYGWSTAASREALFHVHGGEKSAWMTMPRVLITSVISIALWMGLRSRMIAASVGAGAHGERRAAHVRWSCIYLVVSGLSFTLLMWDLLLGLQARFISSTWGFYTFVSSLQTFLALLCIVVAWLARGPLKEAIRPHLLKDLGTWTVAWSCIWGYIAYTQYIIIYFANTNEESYFYLMRLQHGYQYGIFLESILRFAAPFLLLLSQSQRGRPSALCWASGMVLLGAWIDLWWIIMPALQPNDFHSFWALPELTIGAGFLGGFGLLALRFWGRHGLLPHTDPRLLSSINAEHLH